MLTSPGRARARTIITDSGLVHIKTVNMVKVIITGSESRQTMALNQSGFYRIGRKQLVARHQAIGGLHVPLFTGRTRNRARSASGL